MTNTVTNRVRSSDGQVTWDEVRFDRCGVVRLVGWSFLDWDAIGEPQLLVNGDALPLMNKWRRLRPDLQEHSQSDSRPLPGFGFEWLAKNGRIDEAYLHLANGKKIRLSVGLEVIRSDHAYLFDCPDVLGRNQIYGSGAPCVTVDDQIRALMPLFGNRVLDFGCGAGALVRELRQRGKEGYGIEIERPLITDHLLPDARGYITLYKGGPLPYATDAFDCVTAFEVIEHVEDHEFALNEIARVAPNFVMSVPDMSAIPVLHQYNVVPWHLLESTHLNFFTESSLRRTLQRHYRSVEIGRLGESENDGSRYFVSLLAICQR